eukprot:TRINITY_DN53323_c0_g1_i1.p1 TRINITY_DN53323_c0_g1~~TRINITY_DN53323_c0_g1_i1.p1  ORF type:complete len:115 (-),score=32.40 TRINITY_DN53323_c0_g1_i1:16-360(-)
MLRSLVGSEMCIRDSLEIRNRQCVSQLDQRIRDTHSVEKELTTKSAGDSASKQEVSRLHGAVEVLSRELTEAKVEIDRLETDKHELVKSMSCLLYTSDAADEEDSVDIGGRRSI